MSCCIIFSSRNSGETNLRWRANASTVKSQKHRKRKICFEFNPKNIVMVIAIIVTTLNGSAGSETIFTNRITNC